MHHDYTAINLGEGSVEVRPHLLELLSKVTSSRAHGVMVLYGSALAFREKSGLQIVVETNGKDVSKDLQAIFSSGIPLTDFLVPFPPI
ncbi:unnamed protein product [Schistocephalus solidus]|uniref:BLUF domain-containing protein n=1 Tax=Schistocephalus solidus TaxID=70667 RepID=A0A183TI45_SCHSO|nr:unnamed protein product [Schistocephalus solidus]